jgi:broad specificity phosphatase PhoE
MNRSGRGHLYFFRHGESERSRAEKAFRDGEPLPEEEDLMRTHTSKCRLTPCGVEQVRTARAWVHRELSQTMPEALLITAPYMRNRETAGHLELPGSWQIDARLAERNCGLLDTLTHEAREEVFRRELKNFREDPFYERLAPDAESYQSVHARLVPVLEELRQECAQRNVFVSSNSEVMWVVRMILEHWTPEQFTQMRWRKNPQTDLGYCRVIEYSRWSGSDFTDRFSSVRFVNPLDPDDLDSNRDWRPIERLRYSSTDLLEHAALYKRKLPA